jgi:hypothetical protein
MKKKFDWHIWLKQEIDSETLKLYYFRHDENDLNYECEEYIYKNKQVLDLKHGESSKEYFDKVFAQSNILGTGPTVYFGHKGMGWKSFGEEDTIEEN